MFKVEVSLPIEINPCLERNGGCHAKADCIHVGPNKVRAFYTRVNLEMRSTDTKTRSGCVFYLGRLHASAAKVTQVMDRTAAWSTCVPR